MKNIKFLILFIFLVLSESYAEMIIFGVTKEKTVLNNNFKKLEKIFLENKELSKLKNNYHINYSKDQFGDNYAISISDINDNMVLKSLIILLKPTFNDVFLVSSSERTIYLDLEESKEDDNFIVKILLYINGLIDKRFIISILGLFSLILLYKLFRKLRYINKIQKSFKDNQDIIQDKIDNID